MRPPILDVWNSANFGRGDMGDEFRARQQYVRYIYLHSFAYPLGIHSRTAVTVRYSFAIGSRDDDSRLP